jgi:hypothetical protein
MNHVERRKINARGRSFDMMGYWESEQGNCVPHKIFPWSNRGRYGFKRERL